MLLKILPGVSCELTHLRPSSGAPDLGVAISQERLCGIARFDRDPAPTAGIDRLQLAEDNAGP